MPRVADEPEAVKLDPAAAAADFDAALDPDDEADSQLVEQGEEVVIGLAAVGGSA